ncbi:hypothetical protein GH714_011731 [Hevea brasiliensis]|uniref:Uncharacterized protein n=1 Tax=Hevea brasiliensis TaxID=3981 RepID=A0A6A6LSB2_HEVBR|nr:hypothetical protein GH714_011731 [Hevea brasiliensis]
MGDGLSPLDCDIDVLTTCQHAKLEGDVLTTCQHAELEGEVDVYVEDLTMDELKENLEEKLRTRNQKFEHGEQSGITRRNLIKLGHYGVDNASPSEVDMGNNGVDVRDNDVESGKLNKAEVEYVVAHGISQGEEQNETENFHAQTVAEDQVNDDVITEDGREEHVSDKHFNVREEEENDKVHREERAQGDLVDIEYDIKDGDEDVQQVLHEV